MTEEQEARDQAGRTSGQPPARDTPSGHGEPASAEPLLSALPPLVAAALRERTPSAEAQLERDPWAVLLAADEVSVEQADRYAQTRGAALGDPRRSVALIRWLLDQEAGQGHTWMGAAALLESLDAHGVGDPRQAVEAAISEGAMIATEHRGGPVAAPADIGAAEESLAEELARLTAGAGVLLLTGPTEATAGPLGELLSGRGSRHRSALDDGPAGPDGPADVHGGAAGPDGPADGHGGAADGHDGTLVLDATAGRGRLDLLDVSTRVVVRSAQRLGLLRMSALLARVPDGAELVLVGDTADQLPGPGDPLGDLTNLRGVSSLKRRECEVVGTPTGSALERLRSTVRNGHLPPLAGDDRSVVVVPVSDEDSLHLRLRQVLTASLPQRLGIATEESVVLVVGDRGATDRIAGELNRWRVTPRAVVSVRERLLAADAVVVVVPPTGLPLLDRRVLVAASTQAGRQLTVINSVGESLPAAVAAPPAARRTRLPDLLLEAFRWQREL